MSDVESPPESETPNPFAGWTAAQCAEYCRKLAAAQCAEYCRAARTPGQKARVEARNALDKIWLDVPRGSLDVIPTPSEIEQRQTMHSLGGAFNTLYNALEILNEEGQASITLYSSLQRCIESAYTLGRFHGFDGAKAREQKIEKARARDQKIFLVVKEYLLANPQIPCRASMKGAADIQKAVGEILGDKVSLSKLVEALRKLRKE